jgi:hypothetical protein
MMTPFTFSTNIPTLPYGVIAEFVPKRTVSSPANLGLISSPEKLSRAQQLFTEWSLCKSCLVALQQNPAFSRPQDRAPTSVV